jgi:hypothetical protein
MAAIPAAAEVPVRNVLGIGQNSGGIAETPICPGQSKPNTMTGEEKRPAPATTPWQEGAQSKHAPDVSACGRNCAPAGPCRPQGHALHEQRLDETEVGEGTTVT